MNKNDTESIPGMTSVTYHTIMWILVILGILGNILVLVWRCSRKQSGQSLLSVLIISLAVADLFCCHFLLQEAMLAKSVFAGNQENATIYVTILDDRLCMPQCFVLRVRLVQRDHADGGGYRSGHLLFLSLTSIWKPNSCLLPCDLLAVLLGFRRGGCVEIQANLPICKQTCLGCQSFFTLRRLRMYRLSS